MNLMKLQLESKIKEIAKRMRTVREDVGLTAEEMAAKMDISVDDYIAMESGRKDFNFTFIYKFAQVCGIDISDIIEGESPSLTEYTVTRKGEGLPIVRRAGFEYYNLAPMFKNKLAEPFHVIIPYSESRLTEPMHLGTHKGQEIDIVIKGTMKIQLGSRTEILNEGDAIFYDSSTPHDEIALGGKDCEIYAIVINPDSKGAAEYSEKIATTATTNVDLAGLKKPVYQSYVETGLDESGILNNISFKKEVSFNFAYDIVDVMAKKSPDKLAMVHVAKDKKVRKYSFRDISRYSSKAAHYFSSLGIKKGDKVMLVLKRHYQFWLAIIALHKIGAVVIPATHLLVKHDFEYRFTAAKVSAIIATSDGDVPEQVELAQGVCEKPLIKVIVNGKREGWGSFDNEIEKYSEEYKRDENTACGFDNMLMFFTSGTTGYPKIAVHDFRYPLGHFITAKYWHNVDPNGIHLTIADTGWGKALWGKLYGQWMCEAAVFVYDFDKFEAHDILSMFGEHKITTFCAPPTMFRFFIKEDLSRYDLTSLKYATVAGEALNPEVYNQFYKATGVKLMEGFGQTETTLTICNFVGSDVKVGSMGKPSPLYEVDLVLPDGSSAKVGEVGEIVIKTTEGNPCGLFSGYYLDEVKTKEVWYDGYYHTGDTARRDEDGYIWYVGRVDDLIKSSGYRIGPFEVESVIMELPFVLECAITAVPDEIRGQVVKATIVLTKGDHGDEEKLKKEIQNYVKEHTAPYKYPRIVEFRSELPKTISGKIRRVELRNS